MAVRHDYNPNALVAARTREATKPGRQKLSGRGSGLTPRVKKALDLMVHGKPDDRRANVTVAEAASEAGLSAKTLHAALLKPAVMAYHQELVLSLRRGEKPASIRVIAAIRDDPSLRSTAAGQNVQLKAAQALAYEPVNHSLQVNTQVNINGQTVTPGYVIDLSRNRSIGEIEGQRAQEDIYRVIGGDVITIDEIETVEGE